MATATADLQLPWKEFRVKIRNEVLCALGKTGRTGLQIARFFRRRFYVFQFLHLLILRETLTSLMVTSALAIEKHFTIKSQNRVAVVQTSWELTRWYYGYTFRLDLVLLNTWVFWVVSSLDASNCNLTFYKTRQLATWLQVCLKCKVQTGFQAYSSKKKWDLFCLLKFQLSLPQLHLIGPVTQKRQTKGLRF